MFFQKCNVKFNLDLSVSLPSPKVQTPNISSVPKPKEKSDNQIINELISEVIPKFIQFWSRRENKPKTVQIYKSTIDHFIDIIWDIPIDAITSKTVFEYKEKYLKIPVRSKQDPRYAGKTAGEILK